MEPTLVQRSALSLAAATLTTDGSQPLSRVSKPSIHSKCPVTLTPTIVVSTIPRTYAANNSNK